MKKTMIAAGALLLLLQGVAVAGQYNTPNDRASDGSRCGGRAASERAGGK